MRKMINRIYALLLAVLFLGLNADIAYCAAPVVLASATPAIYKVTMKKIEVSRDGGTTYTTLKEEDLTFDIASAGAGGVVGSYISGGGNLVPGTYNKVRATVSLTMTLKGSVTYGVPYYTKNGASGNMSTTASDENEASILIPGPGGGPGPTEETVTQDVSITIKENASTRITIKFDVTGKLYLYDDGNGTNTPGSIYPAPPTVTFTVG